MTELTLSFRLKRKYKYLKEKTKSNLLLKRHVLLHRLGHNQVSDHANVIVSLTTYHKRLDMVYLTIESIFNQKTRHPFEVHLYLSAQDLPQGNQLPETLKRLQRRGLKIEIVEENIKSYKKMFYAAELNRTKTIITVDDDVFYPTWWLDKMLQQSSVYPNAVVAYRGHPVAFDAEGHLRKYESMIENSSRPIADSNQPTYCFLPTGVCGVLYPPGSVAGLENDKDEFMELCPQADDIWFRVRCLMNGIKAVRVLPNNIHFTVIPSSQDDALWLTNVNQGENDRQWENVFSRYPKIKELLMSE